MHVIMEMIEWILGTNAVTFSTGNSLNKPSQPTNQNHLHPTKISNLFPYLTINQPQGKTMKKDQHYCLQLQAMLHQMPFLNGKLFWLLVHGGKLKKAQLKILNPLIYELPASNQVQMQFRSKKSKMVMEINQQQIHGTHNRVYSQTKSSCTNSMVSFGTNAIDHQSINLPQNNTKQIRTASLHTICMAVLRQNSNQLHGT